MMMYRMQDTKALQARINELEKENARLRGPRRRLTLAGRCAAATVVLMPLTITLSAIRELGLTPIPATMTAIAGFLGCMTAGAFIMAGFGLGEWTERR